MRNLRLGDVKWLFQDHTELEEVESKSKTGVYESEALS